MTGGVTLVTGGAGFIGSNILDVFGRVGTGDLVCCDRFGDAARGKWRNIAGLTLADIVAPERLFDWLAAHRDSVDAIIHMGAVSATNEPDVDRIVETNFRLSRDLWRWCAQAGATFVYASSAAIYGDGDQGFDDAFKRAYLRSYRPMNAYGWSKLLFDRWAHAALLRGEAPPRWAGLRFFNVYGPNERHKGAMRSVIAKIWPDVSAGRPVNLFQSHREGVPDGGQKRDFVWVGDCARVAAWFATGAAQNGVYNVGSGRARSFRELAEAVFRAAGRAPSINYVPAPEDVRSHYQYFTEAPIERLRTAGWRAPMTALEDGVGIYVRDTLSKEPAEIEPSVG